jgi:hypothetical protein
VVGYSGVKAKRITATITVCTHAFLDADSVMTDLNSPGLTSAPSGWILEEATAINDSGQIVGWGISPSDQTDGFLLTPSVSVVPEPSALVSLLGLSIAGMIGLWRRKRWAA